jgi:hypothetical protein
LLTCCMRFGAMRGCQEQNREGDLGRSPENGWTERSKADNIQYVGSGRYIYSSVFICLKLPTRSAKTVKTEVTLSNDVSLTFSSLSLNDVLFMVFNLGLTNFNWVHVLSISFNCTHNCLQKFNFKQCHSCQTQLSASKLIFLSFWSLVMNLYILTLNWPTNFYFFNLVIDLVNFNPLVHVFCSVWSLILDLLHQVSNCPSNFNIYVIIPTDLTKLTFENYNLTPDFNFFQLSLN